MNRYLKEEKTYAKIFTRQEPIFMLPFFGQVNGGSIGPFATIHCEPRQARKGAAVTIDASAKCGS